MHAPLTETQKSLLIAAAEHPDQRLEHFPENLKGGARSKVLASLQSKGLIEIREDSPVITRAGLAALGLPATPSHLPAAANPAPAENPVPDAPRARKTRENTKQAAVIALLLRPEGATLDQLVEATQWRKHSIRGALSLLGKKQGLTIVSEKTEAGRVYRAGVPPTA